MNIGGASQSDVYIPMSGPMAEVANTATVQAGDITTEASPGGKLGKEEFLNLLAQQMKNQDPLEPMDSSQMVSQLAQFSALECLGHLGPMMIGELTRKQLVSGGNMTVVVDNLEKEGLVKRVVNAKDRR
ncbi:MAG: flagellar hook capping FlgD N-terminal domain-containing protein, partial [Lentisphaerota bacterium]